MPRARHASDWPVLTSYDLKHLRRVAMPLGGIGTGTISLGGRGDLRDWETCNRPAKGFVPPGEGRIGPFFAVWVKPRGGKAMARLLEGPLDPEDYEGQMGASLPNHGLPRFRQCRFDAAYPLGQVHLSDPDMPITAKLEAFNPLVPNHDDASGLPVAVLRYTLTNRTNKPMDASICGMVPNFIGADGSTGDTVWGGSTSFLGRMKGNRNEFRAGPRNSSPHGVYLHSTQLDKLHEAWGSLALCVLDADDKAISHRTAWANLGWGDSVLDFWDDFLADGRVEDRTQDGDPAPKATLARSLTLPPGASRSVTFVIAWHFPNRVTWTPTATPHDPDALPATTPFVMTLGVSAFQPLAGDIASLELPADWKSVSLTKREFKPSMSGTMINLRDDIVARPPKSNEVVFLVSRIRCDEPMPLDVLLGYDGPAKVWIDGKESMCDPTGTNPAMKDECRIGFHADAGDHEIVIALGTAKGDAWGVFLRYQRTGVSRKVAEKRKVVLPTLLDTAGVSLTIATENAAASSPCCEGGSGGACGPQGANPNWVGNHYATLFADAWDVVLKTAPRLASLEKKTVEFVRSFCESDLPDTVKEAALFNVSTLRSQTTFRTADGLIFGWEGCFDRAGCCHGSCTHVWNYENAVGYLFGGLSRTFRHVELHHSTDDRGVMAFRTSLPIERARAWLKAAADGQMGAIMRFYRDWKLSGEEKFLRDHWNKAKLALSWCWAPGGWDADQDGVMEGCQHNTMDVEYYGPNPQMQFWYLGALRAVEEMARHLGETDFAQRCNGLFLRGSAWADKNLFNGEYYEHVITPLPKGVTPAPETVIGMGAKDAANPDFQIGAGCLVDQLVGQYMAHTVGLGYLANPANVAATHAAIKRHNFKRGFHDHFNNMRSYVLGNESALLMATYPRGRRPKSPFPYYNEVMTGFEYTAAVGMLFEGQTKDGLECIAAIRERYDGRKRNPFNEAECGHHYARAMASWTAVLALTGFQYSGVTGAMRFAAVKKPTTWFWSTGNAWGTVKLSPTKGATRVELAVRGGELKLASVEIAGVGDASLPKTKMLGAGGAIRLTVKQS